MREYIEKLLKEVSSLSAQLMAKGWQGAFQTNGGYSDDLGPSLEKYLFQSMLGREKGIGEKIILSTYARHTDTEKIICDFTLRLGACNAFVISQMDISLRDRYHQELSRKTMEIIDPKNILTCRQVIDAMAPPKEKLSNRPKRIIR
ncbi:hypothetical protein [Pedobacter chitinilyticus]|uniref:Uncharacterized protein n=1 Tax=Pedobacter chitinilyticus TaxID=2233776 RepID=A0A3S3PUA1_9SPHI|nr:hypothetical protein [Pedobacter chitinilyticus]RWU08133.1 hypothetical protein DPV69_07065 [Pedobacter chitinilyticus]